MVKNKDKKLIQNLFSDVMSARSELMFRLGKSYGTKRDLYKDLGYVLFPLFEDYYGKYTRQDIASAIVNAYPDACWGKPPEISEDENEETEFESAWKQLVKEKKIFNYLLRADKAAGIGRFSCLLLGIDDGKRFDEQAEEASRLLYLQVFLECNSQISKYVIDEKNERFGLPETYQLKLSTGDHTQTISKQVHYSRVLHIAENLLDNEIEGIPRLEKVLNRLDDLEKVVGGAGEMFWRGAFQGLAFKAQEGAQFDPEQDNAALEEQIDRYIHGLQRYMKLQGLDVQSISPAVSSPQGHVGVILDLIAGATGIPKRILIGSERGELASSQDETNFSKKVEARKINHCEPNILRPFIDKLIELGILPAPKQSYAVKWPSSFQETEQEKANVAGTKTNAIVAYANSPAAENIVPQEIFLKDILGMTFEEVEKINSLVEGQINQEQDIQEQASRIAKEMIKTSSIEEVKNNKEITTHGGEGSGNFGHGGRPGEVGGSSSMGGGGEYVPKREPSYYGTTGGGISVSANQFITDWQDNPSIVPSEEIIKELSAYVPSEKVVLYRGGKTSTESGQHYQSWSYSEEVASSFVEKGEKLRKRTFYPNEILLDFNRLPLEYKSILDREGMGTALEEVIVVFKDSLKNMKRIRNNKIIYSKKISV